MVVIFAALVGHAAMAYIYRKLIAMMQTAELASHATDKVTYVVLDMCLRAQTLVY